MRTDEVKLKDFIAQLKKARSSVKSTINTDLESMHADDGQPMQTNVNDNRTADLEMAVLVQVCIKTLLRDTLGDVIMRYV